jgi:protein TonB
MKKSLALLAAVNNFYLLAKKYIILKTLRLSSAEGQLITALMKILKKGTTRTTYFIDGTKRNYDEFSNFKKRILNGTSKLV